MPARTPEQLDRLFAEALNAGNAEAVLALYEPGASLVAEPGRVATGTAALREVLEGFLALKPRMSLETQPPIQAGDVALTSSRWTLSGTNPDGSPLAMSGVSVEVARRQRDGSWLFVIDNPFAGA